MIYCVDPSADEPILLINKHIGFDEKDGMGIDGALFQQELLMLDALGKKRIQVWINSPGGSVMDGYNIYSTILKTKTPVDTYAVGGVASIAAVIFQGGRKRIMTDFSWLMYHNPFGSDNKDLINTMKESIIKMIEQRCSMTESAVTTMLNRTSFIRASEAITLNLCDTIDESKFENTKYLKKITEASNFHSECNKVLNSILNNQNTNNMKLVTNRLKLNDAATEENMVKAIDAIEDNAKARERELSEELEKVQNKAKADDSEMDKLKNALKKAEADKAKADEAYNACKEMLDAMEADKKTIEEEAKADKAKNMVEDFAKIGRIKNEETVKLQWVNLAKNDFDGVKAMIEALPLNKKAEDIKEVINKVDVPTTAVGLAAKLRAERNNK
jgi:ATP-dependent protease ClpP protease subunit